MEVHNGSPKAAAGVHSARYAEGTDHDSEARTRIELDARLGVFTPIPFHENANHHFD